MCTEQSKIKRLSVVFFQVVLVLIGVVAFAFLLWEPHIEGRNTHATLFEIYFKDPFLAYAYIASIPFFVGLYQAYKLLKNAAKNEFFSKDSIQNLQNIKKCGYAIMSFAVVGIFGIMLSDSDDKPPGFFMGFIISLAAFIVSTVAGVFEKRLQKP